MRYRVATATAPFFFVFFIAGCELVPGGVGSEGCFGFGVYGFGHECACDDADSAFELDAFASTDGCESAGGRECPINGGFGLVGLVDSSFERYRERVESGLPSHCPACPASLCGVE
jgi:hypothetical protein